MKQVGDCFIIRDLDLEDHLIQFMKDCDADELARIAEQCFGGSCITDGDVYNFYPNENYTGKFGPFRVKEPWREEKVRTAREIRNSLLQASECSGGLPVRLVILEKDEGGVFSIMDIIQFDKEENVLGNIKTEAKKYSGSITCVEIADYK